jgi:hypothetical protein
LKTYPVVLMFFAPVPVELATENDFHGIQGRGRCGALKDALTEGIGTIPGGCSGYTESNEAVRVIPHIGGVVPSTVPCVTLPLLS